LFTYVKTW